MSMATALAMFLALLQWAFVEASSSLSPSSLSSSSSSQLVSGISSNSILVALLDSQHTEFSELIEKASLLQELEEVLSRGSVTILAPKNALMEANVGPDFRHFLLEPRNLPSLQALLRFHVIPGQKVTAAEWRKCRTRRYETLAEGNPNRGRVEVESESQNGAETRQNPNHGGVAKEKWWRRGRMSYETLNPKRGEKVEFRSEHGVLRAGLAGAVEADAVTRPDGIVHTIDRLLIPESVQSAYSAWKSGGETLAIKPESAPSLNSYSASLMRSAKSNHKPSFSAPPSLPGYFFAPASLSAPASAPASASSASLPWLNGDALIADFISTLIHYGGYNEIADLLVNLTSLAPELSKLVTEGYRITLLAPNDEAMAALTAEHLSEPGAPERIIYYHIIPEYQTEESFYNAVRRFGKVSYETLRVPFTLSAQEADGTVQFGDGQNSAHLYDHDIYVDGRISIQGIDRVLMPSSRKSGRGLYEEDDDTEEEDFKEDKVNSPRGFFSSVWCKLGLSQDAYCH